MLHQQTEHGLRARLVTVGRYSLIQGTYLIHEAEDFPELRQLLLAQVSKITFGRGDTLGEEGCVREFRWWKRLDRREGKAHAACTQLPRHPILSDFVVEGAVPPM